MDFLLAQCVFHQGSNFDVNRGLTWEDVGKSRTDLCAWFPGPPWNTFRVPGAGVYSSVTNP
jgi:hypothetical protein